MDPIPFILDQSLTINVYADISLIFGLAFSIVFIICFMSIEASKIKNKINVSHIVSFFI